MKILNTDLVKFKKSLTIHIYFVTTKSINRLKKVMANDQTGSPVCDKCMCELISKRQLSMEELGW